MIQLDWQNIGLYYQSYDVGYDIQIMAPRSACSTPFILMLVMIVNYNASVIIGDTAGFVIAS